MSHTLIPTIYSISVLTQLARSTYCCFGLSKTRHRKFQQPPECQSSLLCQEQPLYITHSSIHPSVHPSMHQHIGTSTHEDVNRHYLTHDTASDILGGLRAALTDVLAAHTHPPRFALPAANGPLTSVDHGPQTRSTIWDRAIGVCGRSRKVHKLLFRGINSRWGAWAAAQNLLGWSRRASSVA